MSSNPSRSSLTAARNCWIGDFISCTNDCSAFSRFSLEERGDCFLRVSLNDQPFLLRAAFTLSAFRFWLFRHLVILSPTVRSLVPEPGIGPGRSWGARGCKPRLSTISSTRATHTGTVTAVPVNSKRNVFVRNWGRRLRFPFVKHLRTFLLPFNFFGVVSKAAEDFVDRGHWRSEWIKVVALIHKLLTDVLRRSWFGGVLNNKAYRVSDAQSYDLASDVRQRPQTIQDFFEVGKLATHFYERILKVSALAYQSAPL